MSTAENLKPQAESALKKHWGHPGFRPGQWEVVEGVLAGEDVLAILPTGGGKSVCYQVPAVVRGGLTLVVSPLIALMQDQVAGLSARGVPAAFINSTLSAREVDQRWTDAEFGRYRLLYVAPERLQSEIFLARAERLKVDLLAVDEAHCISEWGHHFRPAYLEIPKARALLGDPVTIAVTATATPEVRRDIVEHLALRSPRVVVQGFDRPNLVWTIFREENKRAKALDVVKGVEGAGVVYAATRRSVEEWAEWLQSEGERAVAYHAGLKTAERERIQNAWLKDETRLIVATNAFGMGIDKPDVRFVLHVEAPASLESYYQEAGRGGRDGERAYAVLLFDPRDEATQRRLIEGGHPDAKAVRAVYDAVCNLGQVAVGSEPDGPVVVRPEAVARLTGFGPALIERSVELLARQEVWQVLPLRRNQGLLHFRQPADALRRYRDGLENAALAGFLNELLRAVHADAYTDWWEIDLRLLQRRTGLDRQRLLRGFAFLEERGLLSWQAPDEALRLVFLLPRAAKLPVDDEAVRRARRMAETRLDHLLRYARSVTCRRHFLLSYFGEHSPDRCGKCDVCLGRHKGVTITPADEPLLRAVLAAVADGRPRARWFEEEKEPPGPRLDGLVDWLVQEGYLRLEAPLEERFVATEKAQALLDQWAPRERG